MLVTMTNLYREPGADLWCNCVNVADNVIMSSWHPILQFREHVCGYYNDANSHGCLGFTGLLFY